jgi:hypothetical protein
MESLRELRAFSEAGGENEHEAHVLCFRQDD